MTNQPQKGGRKIKIKIPRGLELERKPAQDRKYYVGISDMIYITGSTLAAERQQHSGTRRRIWPGSLQQHPFPLLPALEDAVPADA